MAKASLKTARRDRVAAIRSLARQANASRRSTGGGWGGPLTADLPDPVTDPVHIATGADETQLTVEGITAQNESLAKFNLGGSTPGTFIDAYDGGYASLTVGDYQLISGGRASLSGSPESGSVVVQSPSGQNGVGLVGSDTSDLVGVSVGGATVIRVDENGHLIVADTNPPAAGDVGVNEAALWVDDGVLKAGTKVGGSLISGPIGSQLVYKNDTEVIASSVVPQNDDALILQLAAASKYKFKFHIFVGTNSADPGFRMALGGTVTSFLVNAKGIIYDMVGNVISDMVALNALDAMVTGPLALGDHYAEIEGMIHTNAAGTLLLQWCQHVSDSDETFVKSGSYVEAQKFS